MTKLYFSYHLMLFFLFFWHFSPLCIEKYIFSLIKNKSKNIKVFFLNSCGVQVFSFVFFKSTQCFQYPVIAHDQCFYYIQGVLYCSYSLQYKSYVTNSIKTPLFSWLYDSAVKFHIVFKLERQDFILESFFFFNFIVFFLTKFKNKLFYNF